MTTKQVKRNKIDGALVDRDKLGLVVVLSGNIIGSLLWANDGSLYQVQDGQWYKLTVVEA